MTNERVADFFEAVGTIGGLIPGPVGLGVKALSHAVVTGIRERGKSVEELVAHLHKVEPLNLQWGATGGQKP